MHEPRRDPDATRPAVGVNTDGRAPAAVVDEPSGTGPPRSGVGAESRAAPSSPAALRRGRRRPVEPGTAALADPASVDDGAARASRPPGARSPRRRDPPRRHHRPPRRAPTGAYLAEGGLPSTLGYRGYPKSLCTSVNEVVAHGIPDDRPLEEATSSTATSPSTSTACTATARAPSSSAAPTPSTARTASWWRSPRPPSRRHRRGRAGRRVRHRTGHRAGGPAHGFGIVRELVGHGIGEQFHGDPHVHHYDEPRNRAVLRPA